MSPITAALQDYNIPDIGKVLENVIINRKVTEVKISRLTAPGENYLSLVFRADFVVVDQNGKSETISAVAKRLPLVEKKEGFDFSGLVMKAEIRWYSEIVPLLKDFAKEYNIDSSYFPTYLGSRLSLDPESREADSEAVLLIKNLLPEGYINEDRHVGFDLKTAKASLKALAAFHATGLGMKFKRPEKFQVIKRFMEESRPEPPPPSKDGEPHGPRIDLILEAVISLPGCQPYKKQLQTLKDNILPIPELLQGGALEPWNTIVHNDFWGNNIMITKPPEGQSPAVKILDYQVCLYSSYVKDVVFFLLTTVRDEVARQYFDELLRYYYDELTSLLERIDIPELKLTYDGYLEELKRVAKKFEASHAFMFCNIIFGPKDNVPDHLTGEVDFDQHMGQLMKNMTDRAKERAVLITQISDSRGWL